MVNPMTTPPPNIQAALSSLRERWGDAAPRRGVEVLGSLAVAPVPVPGNVRPPNERAVPTGFRALDSILGLGGLPRSSATAIRGGSSSGKTTLALRAVAQVQAAGGIAAYLDLGRSLDPVEAASRGVRLDWLVVLAPDSIAEALSMAALLLQDRTVDLLLLDLPWELREPSSTSLAPADVAERMHRLAALVRKAGVQLIVLEPPGLPGRLAGALTQVSALRLELSRRAWIRLGREVVGQRIEVRVSRDRFGPPGRTAELRILYAEGGLRDSCLARDELLSEWQTVPRAGAPPGGSRPAAFSPAARPSPLPSISVLPVLSDATSSSPLAPSAHPPGRRDGRAACRQPVPRGDRGGGAGGAGRQAVGEGRGAGRESGGPGDGRSDRDAARGGAPAGA
jgi:recombination protein RecA